MIEELLKQKEEALKRYKEGNKDRTEYFKIMMKIKYWTDEEGRNKKLLQQKERNKSFYKNEAYNEYHRLYRASHKPLKVS